MQNEKAGLSSVSKQNRKAGLRSVFMQNGKAGLCSAPMQNGKASLRSVPRQNRKASLCFVSMQTEPEGRTVLCPPCRTGRRHSALSPDRTRRQDWALSPCRTGRRHSALSSGRTLLCLHADTTGRQDCALSPCRTGRRETGRSLTQQIVGDKPNAKEQGPAPRGLIRAVGPTLKQDVNQDAAPFFESFRDSDVRVGNHPSGINRQHFGNSLPF